ncbi:MAG: thioredoxin family protein [Candidatus Faecivicinus sp.]
MSLFGFGKKKEEERRASACCCGSEGTAEETSACCGAGQPGEHPCCGDTAGGISVKVLGSGCKACHAQYENAKAAVGAMGLNAEVEYITDMEEVMRYGAMSMPAIAVNGQIVSMGKVLKAADVEKLLRRLGC